MKKPVPLKFRFLVKNLSVALGPMVTPTPLRKRI